MQNNRFIGLMSGTSIDAIDVVLVEFKDSEIQLQATYTHPWPTTLRNNLLTLSQQPSEKISLQTVASLDILTAQVFSEAVLALLAQTQIIATMVDAIGSPGQTLHHCPYNETPYTWQLGDPNIIAQLTQIPTVADFRRRDLANGGQGAPLTPAFHKALFCSSQETRCILNIGGITNLTVLPVADDRPILGFDIGPGNALIDAHINQHRQLPMDADGTWAVGGHICTPLLEALLTDPYFSRPPPKSTGRDYFNLDWLTRYTAHFELSAQDIQATLCQLTIESIVQTIQKYMPQRVLICGGGAHNPLFMTGLAQKLPFCHVESTTHYGVVPDWVEAMSFAWFAKQRLAEQPSDLSSITGAKQAVVLGGLYL